MERVYETERLVLKVIGEEHAEAVLDYYIRNKEFLKEWEPLRDDEFYTLEHQRKLLASSTQSIENGNSLILWIFKKDELETGRTIGMIAFNNIVRGVFLSCHLGYKMDGQELQKGYVTEALKKGIEVIFKECKLHRIEANIRPSNKASMKVVEKLGFYNEGLAYKYLKINGNWEDHIHMVLLNDEV